MTRIAALGILAAGVPKRVDDRHLYLTVEGPSTVIVQEIPLKKAANFGVEARRFVSKLNQLVANAASEGTGDAARVNPSSGAGPSGAL